MGKIRKKARKYKEAYDSAAVGWFHRLGGKLATRSRAGERIREINRWAAENPRKFAKRALCAMGGVLLLGMVSIVLTDFRGDGDNLGMDGAVEEIHRTSTLLDDMRSRYAMKSRERELVGSLMGEAQGLAREIDSICKLPALTRADSVAIVRKKQQFDLIMKTLRHDEKD